jgi:hypothetical protein
MSTNLFRAIGETVSSIGNTVQSIGSAVQGFGGGVSAFLNSTVGTDPNLLISNFRAAGIPLGAESNFSFTPVTAKFSTNPEDKDWRVKINCPIIGESPIMQPLVDTNGMVFPYLPSIMMSHSANYQKIDTAHTNYPFYAYQNSEINEITITGTFTVQTQDEAAYWLAMMHFLRTVTKMYFGQGPNLGNPPPICTLNGYGDFVYNNVPIIVKNFTIEMPDNVDYISANLGTAPSSLGGTNLSYVPVKSTVTVIVQPIYSREKIKTFNLDAFAKGQLVVGSDGKGFI